MSGRPAATSGAGISRQAVGLRVEPLASEIDARWLMAYAAALGETAPGWYDTTAAGGPPAHPIFPVCYEWPAVLAVRRRFLGTALAVRGVHAAHRLIAHRPPRAGDRLRTSAEVTRVEARPRGALVTVRLATVDETGAPVTTTDHASLYHGVPVVGAAPGPRPPAAPEAPPAPRWTEVVEVPATAGHVYGECARIWNPIHTDVAVARAAGLAEPILHGTATLALAVSRVVARDLGGDPARVREVSVRFTGMVVLPARLTVRGLAGLDFDVVDAAGRPVLSGGRIRACAA